MKTKKLTLNETWKLCLQMWRWIAKQIRARTEKSVDSLKQKWLEENWPERPISGDCFFCDYGNYHTRKIKGECFGCNDCPGNFVDRQFDCQDKNYAYDKHPIAFYNKLVSLNRKRQKTKGKNRIARNGS